MFAQHQTRMSHKHIFLFLVIVAAVFSQQLSRPRFQPFSLGTIKPRGWLHNQLNVQAQGLSAKVDEIWPDVANSQWLGGWAEGWERFPYFLDGFVPLAVQTQEPNLLRKVHQHVNYILSQQLGDGWLGPVSPNGNFGKGKYMAFDPWPNFVMLKALMQYADAFPQDARIVPAITKFLSKLNSDLDTLPLSKFPWAQYRWQDCAITVEWLYDKTGQTWLLDLLKKITVQGFDWITHFDKFNWTQRVNIFSCPMACHGVNSAQAIKTGAVLSRYDSSDRVRQNVRKAIDVLDKYHGMPNGMFSSDELYAGKNPTQGTELCTVVEYMYSLEVAASILGDPLLADRLELITFNALPSTFDPTMSYHQYVQQVNQVMCLETQRNNFTDVGGRANLYGISPNYGCCTANYNQGLYNQNFLQIGWPKFSAHLWMRMVETEGLVAMAYAPNSISTMVKNTQVSIDLTTDYPFGDGTLQFNISTSAPVTFPIAFRIPGWADNSTITVDGSTIAVSNGTFKTVTRAWSDTTLVTLRFNMAVRAETQFANATSIYRGPLLMSLRMLSTKSYKQHCDPTQCDDPYNYQVTPQSPWNYALQLDPTNPSRSISFATFPVSAMPFYPDFPPVIGTIPAKRLQNWLANDVFHGTELIPASPVRSDAAVENVELVPYGSTNVRVAMFPVLEQ